jgi:hypothetical protein
LYTRGIFSRGGLYDESASLSSGAGRGSRFMGRQYNAAIKGGQANNGIIMLAS